VFHRNTLQRDQRKLERVAAEPLFAELKTRTREANFA
jgi:hypothetical protein